MAIPASTYIFSGVLDPSDLLDYQIDVSSLLETGESISTFTLTVPAESVLLGLTLNTTGGYATTLASNKIQFWVSIDPSKQGNAAFNSVAVLPLELSIVTNSTPARKKQRTVAIQVTHR